MTLNMIARDFGMRPDAVPDLPYWAVDNWIAERAARMQHLAERRAQAWKPTGEPSAEYEQAKSAVEGLKKDLARWESEQGAEDMVDGCKTALKAAEAKMRESAPKSDPFTVALGLLDILADEWSR